MEDERSGKIYHGGAVNVAKKYVQPTILTGLVVEILLTNRTFL